MRPYADSLAHLRDELRRIDLHLGARVEEWWAQSGDGEQLGGLFVSDEEVAALLRPDPDRDGRAGRGETHGRAGARGRDERRKAAAEAVESQARVIRERTRRTVEAGTDLRLLRLADRFGLDPRHVDALLLAVAPEFDRKYERVYAYLLDDVTRTRPTAGLVLRIRYPDEGRRLSARTLFAPSSPLVRHRLVRLGGDPGTPFPSRAVAVDDRVVEYLLGGDDVDAALADVAELVTPRMELSDLPVDAATRRRLARLADRTAEGGALAMVSLHGRDGVGKRSTAEALSRAAGKPLLTASAASLVDGGLADPEVLSRLCREARFQDAAVAVCGLEALHPENGESAGVLEVVLSSLDEFDGPVFLCGTDPLPSRLQVRVDGHDFAGVHLPEPSNELRRALWRDVEDLPGDVDPDHLAATFRLTPGQIEDAVGAAALQTGGDLDREAVYAGCRAQSSAALDSMARAVEPTYGWDDIVLPPDRLAHLREVAARVRNQARVYGDWGFEEKYALGSGLVVLFSGPSGTGKTMAAEILARDSGLELYRIDLSAVVSKYVGETEKNLRTVFDEADQANVILFFDEADALFGKRSEVTDAHDRYANIEVNYLLQRIEEHDGVVVLATNLRGNVDDAFLRRIHLSVDFPVPDREARRELWRGVFPDETPVGEVDFEFLTTFELTGGNVRNVALTSAFLAAEDDAPVEMHHVVWATRRELQKNGTLIDPEAFGPYRDMLRRNHA